MKKLLHPYGKIMVFLIVVGLVGFGIQLYFTLGRLLNPNVTVVDSQGPKDISEFTYVDKSLITF